MHPAKSQEAGRVCKLLQLLWKVSTTAFVATSLTTTSTCLLSIPRTARSTSSTRGLVPCSGLSLPASRAAPNVSAWFQKRILSGNLERFWCTLPPRQIVLPCLPSPSLCSPRPGLLRGPQTSVRHCVFPSFFVVFFARHDHDFKRCLGILTVDIFPSVFLSRVTPFLTMVRLWVLLPHQCSHLIAFAYALLRYRALPTCQYGTAHAATCGHSLRTSAPGHSLLCSVTPETSIRQLAFSFFLRHGSPR